jgi:hypothetical protein
MRIPALAIVLLLVASVAHAEPAPTFAVDLRSRDALADKITDTLENALRDAGARNAHYRAKSARKDRVAASTDECPSALTTACATEIGARLGVDYVFAGEVETHGKRFVLTFDIVNVSTKRRVRSLRDVVATSTAAKAWSKQIFERIVDRASGSLAIACNVSRATVLVDGKQATELYQQRGMVSGLALGRHAVELRAPGYKPYTDEVVIDGETQLDVLLDTATP